MPRKFLENEKITTPQKFAAIGHLKSIGDLVKRDNFRFRPDSSNFPNFDPRLGLRVDLRGSKIVPIEMSSPHSNSTWPILQRLATIHNVPDRETDRAMAIGRPCYSIGGLIRSI